MNLSVSQKLNLLKQLYELSTDTQVIPFLDQATNLRIDNIIQGFSQDQKLNRNLSSLNNKKYHTEMQQINEKYEEKFAHLFTSDDDSQNQVLKEINVHLSQNIFQRPDPKHNNFFKNTTTNLKPTKNSLSKLNRKQNINSLASTHQKLFIPKTTDELGTLSRKKSKDKLISYKVQTEQFQMNQTHGMLKSKPLKNKDITPVKATLNTNHSRSILQSKSPIKTQLKRSQSQANKMIISDNSGSLNTTAKHDKLPLLRQSESKSSLSTSKLKSSSKKSVSVLESTATKRQLNSLPSIQIVQNLVKSKILKTKDKIFFGAQTKTKSKEKRQSESGMKKSMKRIHTQCSVEKFSKKDDFLEEMRVDENLNFDIEPQTMKKQENSNRRVVTEMFPQTEEYESSFEKFEQDQKDKIEQSKDNQTPIQTSIVPVLQQQNQTQNNGSFYLQKIMNEINLQREQKLKQKIHFEREIAQLKQKIIQQKRLLESTLTKNLKLQNQIQTVNSFHKSTINQRTLLQRCINQTKRKVTFKQSITKNHATHTKIISEELKEEQQLIEMYQNVIDELKSEIKEQFKKKNEAKNALDLCSKMKESKFTKFNSTLLSTQKIKHDLTDAFKEWV